MDYAWGVAHLIVSGLIILAGVALFAGETWARVVAAVLAGISAIVNIGFLSAYPAWCAIMIGLDVIVIWAVCAHGREAQPEYRRP